MAKQKLGQHFLFDKNILKKIINVLHTENDSSVLEIGAGMGPLTLELSRSFDNVYAVELDKNLYKELTIKFSDKPNVTIINEDILNVDIESLPVSIAVGNIPYYITTPIIFKLLEARDIKKFGLLMQKEVAKRIVAKEGTKEYGILSVNVKAQADVKIAFFVRKTAFSPPPNVDSAFVLFFKKEISDTKIKALRNIVKAAFGMRRKTIFNNLKALLGEDTEWFIKQFDLPLTIRAEEIPLKTYLDMADLLIKKGRLKPPH